MKLEALPSWGPAKTKGKLVQGTRVRESLESETRGREGSLDSWFQVISEEDKFRYNFSTDMAKHTNAYFETYVKKAYLKQYFIMDNPVPDNLDHV